ncbi:hypothetical protein J6590_004827 [Homalodisca vitripennis]|nr:hypothetical protein J6590_004827 [Homalodisca vitripennis]
MRIISLLLINVYVVLQVEPTDTLASVAAHFDITPSELAILNRLPSRTVFPGQVIRVPDKRRRDGTDSEDKENKQDNPEGTGDTANDDKNEVCDDEMATKCGLKAPLLTVGTCQPGNRGIIYIMAKSFKTAALAFRAHLSLCFGNTAV